MHDEAVLELMRKAAETPLAHELGVGQVRQRSPPHAARGARCGAARSAKLLHRAGQMLEQEQQAREAAAKALLPEPEPEHVASALELLGFEVGNQLQVRRTAYAFGSPAPGCGVRRGRLSCCAGGRRSSCSGTRSSARRGRASASWSARS